MNLHEVSILYDVKDATTLFQAAYALALKSGVERHVALEVLKHQDGSIHIDNCLLMLVDRGRLPGCETVDSNAEEKETTPGLSPAREGPGGSTSSSR